MVYIYEKQKDDYKLQISVDIFMTYREIEYRVTSIKIKKKNQRKFREPYPSITDDYTYRRLPYSDGSREKYCQKVFLQFCDMNDITEAAEYAYQQIKPTKENITFSVH